MRMVIIAVALQFALLRAPLIVEAAEPSASNNWSSFRNGNLLHGTTTLALPDKLELLWSHKTDFGFSGAPAIYDGIVYSGSSDGKLFAFEGQTGKLVWTYDSPVETGKNSFAPGFPGSPLVDQQAIYIGDEDGVIHCVDRKTGQRKWTYKTEGEIKGSASKIDDKILIGSYDNCLYCLEAENGSLVWKYETEGYVNCTPAVVDGVTFVTGCDEQLRLIDLKKGEQIESMSLETFLIASPAIWGDHLYVGTHGGEVLAVNWKELTIDWRYKGPGGVQPFQSSAAVTEELVVVGGGDRMIHAIDRKTGEGVWTFATRAKVDSSPVIAGGRVYVGSKDGNVYQIDLTTGKEVGEKLFFGNDVDGSPAVGGNQLLVIGSFGRNGELRAYGKK